MDLLWYIHSVFYWVTLPLSELLASTYYKTMFALLPVFWAHEPLEHQDNPRNRVVGLNMLIWHFDRECQNIF